MKKLLSVLVLFVIGADSLSAGQKTPDELFQQKALFGNTAVDLLPLPQLYQREKYPLIVRVVRKEESIELLIREFAEGEGKRVHASLIHRTMKFETPDQASVRKFIRGGTDYDTGLNTKFADTCAQVARKLMEVIDQTVPRDVRDRRGHTDRFSDDSDKTVLLEYLRDGRAHGYIVVRDYPTSLDNLRREFASLIANGVPVDSRGR